MPDYSNNHVNVRYVLVYNLVLKTGYFEIAMILVYLKMNTDSLDNQKKAFTLRIHSFALFITIMSSKHRSLSGIILAGPEDTERIRLGMIIP